MSVFAAQGQHPPLYFSDDRCIFEVTFRMEFPSMTQNPRLESKRFIAYDAIRAKGGDADKRRNFILRHGLDAILYQVTKEASRGAERPSLQKKKTALVELK